MDDARKPAIEDDKTVVVNRAKTARDDADVDEHTLMIPRREARGTDTNAAMEADYTVVVPKRAPSMTTRTRSGRRRGIAAPPVPEGFAPEPMEAIGPLAVEEYRPRTVPAPPTPDPEPHPGLTAARADMSALPSVSKRSARSARITLVVLAASAIGAVVGLIAMVVALRSL